MHNRCAVTIFGSMATKMKRKGKTKLRGRTKKRGSSSIRKTVRKISAASKNVKISVPSVSLPTDAIKKQLLTYSDQIDSYLKKINAKVESFTFDVTNFDQGLTIDCKLKATIAE